MNPEVNPADVNSREFRGGRPVTIEAMIFDFGNVLIGWNPEHLYRSLIPDALERRRFLDEVCSAAWNHQQDLGRTFAEAIAERIALYPDHAALIRAYHERFGEMLSGPIAEGHDILERVAAKGIPCYGLTNWSAETFEASRAVMPFLCRMAYTAVSGRLKIGKPEPEIFRHLLDVIGKPAENCAFLDDSPVNIEAARKLGLKAVLFKNDGSALAELRKVGLGI
jgi:2-haloacid dehalogenase